MPRRFLFTSESVSEGHPDKLCDQISDAVLDACLKQDPNSKVACESCAAPNFIMVFGEITTNAVVNYAEIVRETVKAIGYDSAEKGLDYKTVEICIKLNRQSPEIAAGVYLGRTDSDVGAGDQGLVFGYACDETPEFMPLSHSLACRLSEQVAKVRKDGTCPWARPDAKTQVTVEYVEGPDGYVQAEKVHTILISCQHDPQASPEDIRTDLIQHVVRVVVPPEMMDETTKIITNPSGSFVVGGPHGDAGLTGRKIIVDTYGGWGSHGGGAFSGKDSTKVDRSGAYMSRHVAKSLVANNFCKRVLVQVSYAIGVAEPLSLYVNSYGTCIDNVTDSQLEAIVRRNFDFRPGKIIHYLELTKPVFRATAACGHFGRAEFSWEAVKDLSHEHK